MPHVQVIKRGIGIEERHRADVPVASQHLMPICDRAFLVDASQCGLSMKLSKTDTARLLGRMPIESKHLDIVPRDRLEGHHEGILQSSVPFFDKLNAQRATYPP